MKKILIVCLAVFLLIDAALAITLFDIGGVSKLREQIFPKKCTIVDDSNCKSVKIIGDEKLNETVIALFTLPRGQKVYAPVDGNLIFERLNPGNLPYHYLKGDDGVMYFFVFEPESTPKIGRIKSGEVIGITKGTAIPAMKGGTLGVSTVKNQQFDKESFYAILGK